MTEGSIHPEWTASPGGNAIPARAGRLTRIAATWHAAINFLVPIGYEDEMGFHYGEMPVPTGSRGRSF